MATNKTWYFTFGVGQLNEGKVQPIECQSPVQARDEMIRRYGLKWSMQYSQSQWEQIKRDAASHGYSTEEELLTITLSGTGEVRKCT